MLIEREVRENKLDRYKVNWATSITKLMYANGIVIFTKANLKSLSVIKKTLGEFTT